MIVILAFLLPVSGQVLLKNTRDMIPVKSLEAVRFEIIGRENPFLAKAREVASLYKEELAREAGDQMQINLLLISDIQQLAELNGLLKDGHRNIFCFLGIDPQGEEQADAVIYLAYPDVTLISRTIQAIFGGTYFYERLARSTGPYSFGSGIQTSQQIRISFPGSQRAHYYQPLKDTLEKLMHEGLDSQAYPGAQLLVLYQGEVAVMGSYGYHTYDHINVVKNRDLYDMASITKVTTATPALMSLYEEGKIDLDQSLCNYFPVLCKSNKADIPLREVLAHQGRLEPYIVYWQNTLRKSGKFKGRTFKKNGNKRYPIKITDSLYLHRKYKKKIDKAIVESPLNKEPG
jgi:hypothetical protein